ncbi:hypothetical protein [Fulvivirga sp.]|uniref:hypothetical protein n=1 Tax=Fulvivirga sp. TaxID=1931237 RepID=UPI0032EBD3E7
MFKNYNLSNKNLLTVEIAIAIAFSLLPLFFTFPYKINLYLTWEGAYRIYIGQFPFRDFGMPLGYGFWLIPALFFKIFGPFMSSLIKAQVFINLLSLLAVHSIFRVFEIKPGIRVIGILFFSLSFVFIHFWPWYNHTVFVYELIGVAFILQAIIKKGNYAIIQLILGALFIFLSLFTKQDIGGIAMLFAFTLLLVNALMEGNYKYIIIYTLAFVVIGFLIIIPLTFYDFGYWFNYGQAPHGTRIALLDLLDTIFSDSSLIMRLYLAALVIFIVYQWQAGNRLPQWDKKQILFLLFTIGIIVQPLIAQLTTYIPENSHYYYHAFVFTFFLSQLKSIPFQKLSILLGMIFLIFLLWSQDYWRYANRIAARIFKIEQNVDYNYVSKKTWKLKEENKSDSDRSEWKTTPFRSLDNVMLPESTIEGIKELKAKWSGKNGLKVLNMSELPQLAYEIGYEPLHGQYQPLWFHRNVAFFQREVDNTCRAIVNGEYELALFEVIPNLNRFYPPSVRTCLQENYKLVKTIKAPRIPEDAFIEIYERKN